VPGHLESSAYCFLHTAFSFRCLLLPAVCRLRTYWQSLLQNLFLGFLNRHAVSLAVLVDGAHAPGNIVLDIPSIGADWYAANLHKWCFVPRGCGFLWAARDRQKGLVPNVLSWDIDKPFPQCFGWTGTRDPSAWLSIPSAFAFMDRLGADEILRHNHTLVRDGIRLLAEAWKVAANTPDGIIGSMALMPLPDGLPFPATDEGCRKLQKTLWESHKIMASPSFVHEGRIWLRVSAQIYNEIDDYQKLAQTIGILAA